MYRDGFFKYEHSPSHKPGKEVNSCHKRRISTAPAALTPLTQTSTFVQNAGVSWKMTNPGAPDIVSGWMFDRYHTSDSCMALVRLLGDLFKEPCEKSMFEETPVALKADRYVDMYRESIIDWSWDSFRGLPETVAYAKITERFCNDFTPLLQKYLQKMAGGSRKIMIQAKYVPGSAQAIMWFSMLEGSNSITWRR